MPCQYHACIIWNSLLFSEYEQVQGVTCNFCYLPDFSLLLSSVNDKEHRSFPKKKNVEADHRFPLLSSDTGLSFLFLLVLMLYVVVWFSLVTVRHSFPITCLYWLCNNTRRNDIDEVFQSFLKPLLQLNVRFFIQFSFTVTCMHKYFCVMLVNIFENLQFFHLKLFSILFLIFVGVGEDAAKCSTSRTKTSAAQNVIIPILTIAQ